MTQQTNNKDVQDAVTRTDAAASTDSSSSSGGAASSSSIAVAASAAPSAAAAAASSQPSEPEAADKQKDDGSDSDDEDEVDKMDVAELKRKKVPLELGFSEMHWMQYVRTAVRRPQKSYTLADIATHTDPRRSVWMAIHGRVYDVTPYLRYHPGGIPQLMRGAGKDCTKMFDKVHAYVNLDLMMAPLQIGTLVAEKK